MNNIPDDLGPLEQTSVIRNIGVADGSSFYDRNGTKIASLGSVTKGEEGYYLRSNRKELRIMLTQHLDIKWSKRFIRYEENENGVTAFFEDGTSAIGDILVGADGVHSRGDNKEYPKANFMLIRLQSVTNY